jgi:hypothetical protein
LPGARKSILIADGTGSGKTSLLNVMSQVIPSYERIVTIEDARELQIQQPNWVAMETVEPYHEGGTRGTIGDLVRNALRQGITASRGSWNIVIALPDSLHDRVSELQDARGLHNPERLAEMSGAMVIRKNIQVMLDAGVRPSVVHFGAWMTVETAVEQGALTRRQAKSVYDSAEYGRITEAEMQQSFRDEQQSWIRGE